MRLLLTAACINRQTRSQSALCYVLRTVITAVVASLAGMSDTLPQMPVHDHDDAPAFLMAAILGVMQEQQGNPRAGWVYVAHEQRRSLLKIGGTSACPYCRVQGRQRIPCLQVSARLRLVALSASDDWRLTEQRLLYDMSNHTTPVHGSEWYAYDELHVQRLIRDGWVIDPDAVAVQLAERFG